MTITIFIVIIIIINTVNEHGTKTNKTLLISTTFNPQKS